MTEASDQGLKLTLPQVCARLRKSRDQVIRLIHKGGLEGGQVLGRWFATEESVERYLQAREKEKAEKG